MKIIYLIILLVLASATVVEHFKGSMFAYDYIYGSWWMSLLWCVGAALSVYHFVKSGERRWHIIVLHASFVLILCGAAVTHICGEEGYVTLSPNEPTEMMRAERNGVLMQKRMPVTLCMTQFDVHRHSEGGAESGYTTHLLVNGAEEVKVEMNKIYSNSGYRFYQKSYNPMQGTSTLGVTHDPWGIGLTYAGYAMLFFALLWMLVARGGTFRALLVGIDKQNSAASEKGSGVLFYRLLRYLLLGCAILLGVVIARRGYIGGYIPLTNAYETLLALSFFVLVLVLAMAHYSRLLLVMGGLVSAFFYMVSNFSCFSPEITPLMPVLASPLLGIHVSVIMLAYALISIIFICAIFAFVKKSDNDKLVHLCLLLLYPSLATLCIGIFVGAIWAAISWGSYWSWDPKETWALITLMVYAIPVHRRTLPCMKQSRFFLAYLIVAYLVLLMTYFGVNFLLGGMHSYA